MPESPSEIEVGKKAPDFTLEDQHGEKFTLSDYKDRTRVLLSFHPLAGTEVCAKQMQALENSKRKFQEYNAVPVGISVDPVPSKKLWAEKLGLEELRILSDFWPHGEVSKKYGLFMEEKGFSKRANILIDEDQNIVFSKVYPIGEVPDVREIISELKERR
ncbi:MAG: peroxiredoxin [Candidatus Thermoplasmatota archaeon]|nr:peroxiredoxin [Candidatus Thermoplasmatota archaeon]MBS3790877.1 peroxiredoxin [Candidatus Thermoplasmatota archaeon]